MPEEKLDSQAPMTRKRRRKRILAAGTEVGKK